MLLSLVCSALLSLSAGLQPVVETPCEAPSADSTAAVVAAAPEIWFVFPAEGAQLDPVFIFGMNHGDLPIPFFGVIPSVPLYTFSTPSIPMIGSFSLTVTAVPWSLFPGVVDLTVVSNFQASNAVSFRML